MRFRDHVLQLYRGQRTFYQGVCISPATLVVGIDQGGGGEATSHTSSYMKSKRCSHNLQSDQQGSCQRICVLIMRITSKTIDQRSREKTKTWQSKAGLFLTIMFW